MKNYLFYKKRHQNWKINFEEVEHQVNNLLNYEVFFQPKYRYRTLGGDGGIPVVNDEVQYWAMQPHDYCYFFTNNYKIDGNNIDAGYLLISLARNEGQSIYDYEDSIQKDFVYYLLQPLGWASFYSIEGFDNTLNFTFDENAAEHYTTNYNFNFTIKNLRYNYSETINKNSNTSNVPIITTDETITEDEDVNIIQTKMVWKDISRPPMSILLYGNDELITDCTNRGQVILTEGETKPIYHIEFDDDVKMQPGPEGTLPFQVKWLLF